MRLPVAVLVCLIPSVATAQEPPPVAPTGPKTPAEELASFKLPPGFAAQLVASEPDIQKPMQCAFDAKGRLWVTTSHHYPFAAEAGKATDKLFVLSDFGPDGKAKKVETFTADLNIPIGILPMPDCKSCIVSSVGEIRKLTDTDGDGKADKTEVLFTGFGTRDTHGMYNSFTLMPDGWVYACHGYLNDSKVKGKDGHEVHMNSGNTFRFRPDGSRIEIHTHGQVNPFGIAVDPWFNLYTADCHTKPITQLIPGAWYDSFGKPHDGLGYAPHVTTHSHGSTALCGLTWYDADHFPREFTGCMFLGNVVTGKINFDRIEWKGSTPVAKELPDFLVSGDPWFRPVDIKLGPDGALYVTDFYNRIIGHYEVPLNHPGRDKDRGRVWRIVWTGLDGKAKPPVNPTPAWPAAEMTLVLKGMIAPNLTSRLQAANEFAARVKADPTWTLPGDVGERIGLGTGLGPTSAFLGLVAMAFEQAGKRESYRDVVKAAADASAPERRQLTGMVLRALGGRQTWTDEDRSVALNSLNQFPESPHLLRAVIEGLSTHPAPGNIKPLLALIPRIAEEDSHLKFAARLALRNGLQTVDDWAKADLPANDPVVADVALGIPTARAARYVANSYRLNRIHRDRLMESAEFIGRRGDQADRSIVAHTRLASNVSTIRAYEAVLRGAQAAGVSEARGEFQSDLNTVYTYCSPTNVAESRAFVAVAKQAAAIVKREATGRFLADRCRSWVLTGTDPTLRTEALLALADLDPTLGRAFARDYLADPNTPVSLREKAAVILAGSKATADLAALTDAFKSSPYRLAATIATGLARDKVGAELLLSAVKAGHASPRLLQEKAVLDGMRAARVPTYETRVAELTKDLPSPDARLAAAIRDRTAGFVKAKPDLAAGKQLFAKNCAACHQVAGEGGKVAPNLDGIGTRGLDRLLEDVLDPNRNVDANFRATRFDTTDGRAVTGLLKQADGDVFQVFDAEGKEVRLPKGVVDKQTPLTASPMPADVAEKLKESEIYDLMGYLLSLKSK